MFVSNSSTLILIAKIGLLDKLLDYYSPIIIPEEVAVEIKAKDCFEVILINEEIMKNRIVIGSAKKDEIIRIKIDFHMDEGEAAAYTIFDKLKHQAIFTDDRELMKACRVKSIPFICAMASIIALYNDQRLTKEEAFYHLEKLYKHGWYSKKIYNLFRSQVK